MTHYVAIIEEEPGSAVGIWFPDLPGCFSAGDSPDEAMMNAREALGAWADVLAEDGETMPRARSLVELRTDPETAADIAAHMVALVAYEPRARAAAE